MRQPYYLMRLLVCCALLAGNLHAQIATAPLTTQAWVAPNVVVTLDDSPSMEQECSPGGLCSYETNKFNDEPLVAGSVGSHSRGAWRVAKTRAAAAVGSCHTSWHQCKTCPELRTLLCWIL